MSFRTIEWLGDKIRLIDQTRLPLEEVHLELSDYRELAAAIRELKVRGAPAIGIAGAYGLALAALEINTRDREGFLLRLRQVHQELVSTRPTAVNLKWGLDRVLRAAERALGDVAVVREAVIVEARAIEAEDEAANRALAEHGAALIEDGFTVLTHCNAGGLATGGYGTAGGVIRRAWEQGKRIQVYADETRPLLQGARLTAWEFTKLGIPVTLITDNMAGHFLHQGRIDCVVVGADRIAANGDTANKIGTYGVAVLAVENGVPFYVAAPTSTIDLSLASGAEIPIEERSPEEVTTFGGRRIAPAGVKVANPAFDVTPHTYVTAIITERGVIREPYAERMASTLGGLSKLRGEIVRSGDPDA